MKKFLWLGFLLTSCVTTPKTETPVFMSDADIVAAFQKAEIAGVQEEKSPPKDKLDMVRSLDEVLGDLKTKIDEKRKNGVTLAAAPSNPVQSVDLRDRDTPVVNQWDGTCSAFGLSAVIENQAGVNLSERHVWSRYKRYSCDSAISVWANDKACITTSNMWLNSKTNPYKGYTDSSNCYTYLSKVTYIEDDLNKMVASLAKGKPVYIGMRTTKSMLNCDSTLTPASKSTSGGHALAIVGYKLDSKVSGGGYFTIKNSWGPSCGDKGYQYIPFNYCTRSDMYCVMWTIDEVTVKK